MTREKEITFKTGWVYVQGESFILDSKKINIDYTNPKVGYETIKTDDLYEHYINIIANAEYKCGTDKIIYNAYRGEIRPCAFYSKNDVMSFFNI